MPVWARKIGICRGLSRVTRRIGACGGVLGAGAVGHGGDGPSGGRVPVVVGQLEVRDLGAIGAFAFHSLHIHDA